MSLLSDPFFIRNMVYGLEDSLISTTGVIVGTTFAGMPLQYIVTVGIILVFVEALSMAFGSLVSEESFMITSKKKYTNAQIWFYALTMFFSYFFAGILVLLPYIFAVPYHYVISIIISIVGLFLIVFFIQKDLYKALLLSFAGSIILALTIVVGRMFDKKEKEQMRVL
jgi:VIT1/CCC1 family predicted Fe2+/Mn2+ transporter